MSGWVGLAISVLALASMAAAFVAFSVWMDFVDSDRTLLGVLLEHARYYRGLLRRLW
jgi:hypothetical protein